MNSNKNEIRRELRGKIAALSLEEKSKKSAVIVERVQALLANIAKSNPNFGCGGFLGMENEPDLRKLYKSTTNSVAWAFPKLAHNSLVFASTGSSKFDLSSFSKNEFGIEEPTGGLVSTQALQAILVPGLGFDENLNRIGRGKGFYDRALKDYWGLKIGICFSEQFVNRLLAQESHDVPVDYIVTDAFIYKAVEKSKQ